MDLFVGSYYVSVFVQLIALVVQFYGYMLPVTNELMPLKYGLNLEFIVIWNDSTIASKSEWVIQRLFIFLWDPSLPYIVVFQEFSLVAYLVFQAWDLLVYRLIIGLVFLI